MARSGRRCERLVQELGLQEHVLWHGETGDALLVQAYQQCDVFALPNRQVGRDIEGLRHGPAGSPSLRQAGDRRRIREARPRR